MIRLASGCHPTGYGWAGASLDLDIPAFSLADATLEEVVANVTNAPEPTMWVVAPNEQEAGCIDNPQSLWQIGFYSYDPSPESRVFRQSAGPALVE